MNRAHQQKDTLNEAIVAGRRQDPEIRRRLSGPGMRTFFNIAAAWGLGVGDQRGLLGWPAPSTYHKYKSGRVGTLSYDALVRISLIVGIYKACTSYIRSPNWPINGSSCATQIRPSAAARRLR